MGLFQKLHLKFGEKAQELYFLQIPILNALEYSDQKYPQAIVFQFLS